ncbi:hypothetical protein [Nonomuraea jabiensis]|uniref:Uncharacterized protein n=1 Tax=Nonomuraea jabiensis TaxID=882448 RepID=A0A7W9L7J7_9ACTN|nr:hypothetical protein [Nonomuraea jabiensis]MBB5773546.1 hypothetical protein [Nonomuraea jabiensis]
MLIAASLGLLVPGGSPALDGTAAAAATGLIGANLTASFDDIVDLFVRNP